MTKASRIRRISFTASNLARAEDFYTPLGFEAVGTGHLDAPEMAMLGLPRARAERLVMRIGAQEIEFLSFDPPGRRYPQGSGATDGWFQHIAIVVADMAEAYAHVLTAGSTAITRGPPQTLPPNTGRVTAYKFRDPDGHPLELLAFPQGVGTPGGQATKAASPFLGIDHTALVVEDPARSEAFYATLGLAPASRSLNRGPEQSRLDDVADSLVRVVALRLPHTPPHVELLGYRVGPSPATAVGGAANDVAATRMTFDVDRIEGRDATSLTDGSRAVMLKDPDGHRLVLHEPVATAPG